MKQDKDRSNAAEQCELDTQNPNPVTSKTTKLWKEDMSIFKAACCHI